MEVKKNTSSTLFKLLIPIYIVCLILVAIFILPNRSITLPSGDFISYFIGAEILESNPTKLYDLPTQKDAFNQYITPRLFQPYTSMPITTLVFLPLTKIGNLNAAWLIWFATNIGLFFFSGLLFFRNLKKALFFFAAGLLFLPAIDNLILGQVGILILLVVSMFKLFVDKENYYLAGLSLSLMLIKPELIFMIPFLILIENRNNQQLKKLLFGFGIGIALMGLILAVTIQRTDYITNIERFNRAVQIETVKQGTQNQFNTYTILRNNFSMQPMKAVFFNLIISSAFLIFLSKLKSEFKDISNFALVAIIMGVISSIGIYIHGLIYIFPFLFVVLHKAISNKDQRLFLICILLYLAPVISTQLLPRLLFTNTVLNILVLMIPTYFIADSNS